MAAKTPEASPYEQTALARLLSKLGMQNASSSTSLLFPKKKGDFYLFILFTIGSLDLLLIAQGLI